jgi:hypothetical protein
MLRILKCFLLDTRYVRHREYLVVAAGIVIAILAAVGSNWGQVENYFHHLGPSK